MGRTATAGVGDALFCMAWLRVGWRGGERAVCVYRSDWFPYEWAGGVLDGVTSMRDFCRGYESDYTRTIIDERFN